MRLNAYLARAGVASRRSADELIKAGRVTVNGEAGQLNTFVEQADRVEVDGLAVAPQALAYVLLHKPAGVVTTARDPQRRPTVVDLVRHDARVVPVGRLDADTTGALLLTNDGPLAHRLAHPRYGVEKVYEVEVEGDPSDEQSASSATASSSTMAPPQRHARSGSGRTGSSSRSTRGASTRSSGCARRWGSRSCGCTGPATQDSSSATCRRAVARPHG